MLSYPGGKAIHTKWIVPQLPEPDTFDIYVEPFAGSFWIYIKGLRLKLKGKTIIANDADPFIANNWFCIAFRRDDLIDRCRKMPPHNKDLYEEIKSEIEQVEWEDVRLDDIDLASKHLYLISQRFVAPGYTLPKPSSGKWERFIRDLDNKAEIFDCITNVENMDFQEVIEKYDSPDTLFYVDPPYFSTEKYYHQEFLQEDHLRLAECLKSIKGKFALSYYSFPELVEWFPEDQYPWHREVKRNMMGTKKGVKLKNTSVDTEVLIKNYSFNEALSEAKRELIEF